MKLWSSVPRAASFSPVTARIPVVESVRQAFSMFLPKLVHVVSVMSPLRRESELLEQRP